MPKNPLNSIKALILDMDGVIWRGDKALGDLQEIFNTLERSGVKYLFATNNGSNTPETYVEKLAGFGIKIEPWQVVTSAQAVVRLLKDSGIDEHVFAVGGHGLLSALTQEGYKLLEINDAFHANAVVMGLDRRITYEKMSAASLLVSRGVPFFATNFDKTYPTPDGEVPGAGSWISVVTTATGKSPAYAGKPYPYMFELAIDRLNCPRNEILVIGDRLETDIAGAQAARMPSALVLTGVATLSDGQSWRPKVDHIFDDLGQLVKSLVATRA